MKLVLFTLISVFSIASWGENPKTGEMERKECECETCLAKGNCVFRDDQGRKIVEKAVKPREKGSKAGQSGATGI
jgi:hypothetical protein